MQQLRGSRTESYLKWLIDERTSSSYSIGPGTSTVGCGACDVAIVSCLLSSFSREDSFLSCGLSNGVLSKSDSELESRSVEYGVLSSKEGECCR